MFKFGRIAVLGYPNAGKSSLVNRLVGRRANAVSSRSQTTTFPAACVGNFKETQFVLFDTPGLIDGSLPKDRHMFKAAWNTANQVDQILLVWDAQNKRTRLNLLEKVASKAQKNNINWNLVLNKIDGVHKPELLTLTQELTKIAQPKNVFYTSCLDGTGCEDLLNFFTESLPVEEWHFSGEEVLTIPMDVWAAEIVREQLLELLDQEVPYGCEVVPMSWIEKGNKLLIEQKIMVAKENYKAMVIGNQGKKIKEIGVRARKIIEGEIGPGVTLLLTVKVGKNMQTLLRR